MPGIASDRSPGIQISPIASIGADIPPTPAIGDLMEAFKSGFVTVSDLQRRNVQDISTNDQLKTQLQASDFQRKLAPGAFANAQAAQGLQSAQIQAAGQILPGATQLTLSGQELAQQEADRQAALTSDDSKRHAEAVEDATKRQYVDIFGSEPPKSISIPALNPEPVDDFNTWLQKTHGKDLEKQINDFEPGVPDPADHEQIIVDKINAFQSGFPLNSKNDNIARAKYANALEIEVKSTPTPDQLRAEFANKTEAALREDPSVRTEYEQYRITQGKQTDTLKPGSPEYAVVLRQRIQDAQDKAALRAAKLTAVPKILEEQAKAVSGAPAKAGEAASKLRAEVEGSKPVQNFRLQETAANLVTTLATMPNPSNRTDLQLIYAGVKLADPGSVVREGEIALSRAADPALVRMKKNLEGVTSRSGKLLDATDRAELVRIANTVIEASRNQVRPEFQKFERLANQQGVPLLDVLNPSEATILSGPSVASSTPPPANVGAKRVVQNGTTFEWNGTAYVPVQ